MAHFSGSAHRGTAFETFLLYAGAIEGDVELQFGTYNRFSIEAEPLGIHDKWSFGRLRFWVGGVPIGDFNDTSDLASSARWGRRFLAASSRRARADLDRQSPAEVYERLYGRFVESVDARTRKPWPGPWERDPHVLDEVGESSLRDRFAVLVVRRADGFDRILVNDFHEKRLSETCAPEGDCDHTIEAYCAWVEGLCGRNGA